MSSLEIHRKCVSALVKKRYLQYLLSMIKCSLLFSELMTAMSDSLYGTATDLLLSIPVASFSHWHVLGDQNRRFPKMSLRKSPF